MAVPPDIPHTTPVVEPIVAMVTSLLDHVPPPVRFTSVVQLPSHTRVGPVVLLGIGFTVMSFVE
jgi:hypothetical protein